MRRPCQPVKLWDVGDKAAPRGHFRIGNEDMPMIRSVLAAAFVAGFAASPALADRSDCATKYNEFWEKMQRYAEAKPSTDDLVATQRLGLRAYDACQAGDESDFS